MGKRVPQDEDRHGRPRTGRRPVPWLGSTARGRSVFVTGTDTGIGKTHVSAALIHALRDQGLRVAGMKPIASGCVAGVAEDALQLAAASGLHLPQRWINPIRFDPPIAPHIAAALANQPIRLNACLRAFQALSARADLVVVEGVGGWSVPLGPRLMLAELPRRLRLPVILVVGLRLGCINHALLSAAAIRADGCELVGWIGNHVDPQMAVVSENIESIARRIGAPLLGCLPHQSHPDPASAAAQLWLQPLASEPRKIQEQFTTKDMKDTKEEP
jgi:dethiobiotin synthetase